jgi:hypothetical protein
MKTRSLYLLTVAGVAVFWCVAAPQNISGQNVAVPAEPIVPELTESITYLTLQNKQLTENQARIDAMIADLGETIRVSRIAAARSGRKEP